jgi:DUF1707 SHOCT-like domain
VTDAERERLAQALGRHYAEDRIDADELSRRLDVVYGDAPDGALDGLPPLATVVPEKKRRLWGRRHGEADRPQPGWVPTKERFVDPSTGRVMRVWVDAGSHTRHYVAERG